MNAIYTCPMHPEIRQVGPGSCPICGMALEPVAVTLDDRPDPELRQMSKRFWISLVFTAPLFALVMLDMLIGRVISDALTHRGRVLAELALATPVCTPSIARGRNAVSFTRFARRRRCTARFARGATTCSST